MDRHSWEIGMWRWRLGLEIMVWSISWEGLSGLLLLVGGAVAREVDSLSGNGLRWKEALLLFLLAVMDVP